MKNISAVPRSPVLGRRALIAGVAAGCLLPARAAAFGQEGAFHARVLATGRGGWQGPRATGPGRWAWELVRRTSAPGRLVPSQVAADDPRLLAEPFALWVGDGDLSPLSGPEIRGLRRFIQLGGVLVVDDSDPTAGAFGRAARREIARVVPDSPLVKLAASSPESRADEHVLFKSYYLLDGAFGRVSGPAKLDAVVRGGNAQVIFLEHDLLGALARTPGGSWTLPCEPGGARQREYAVRFACNLAMYVLCSDYKDDQVHAREIMRRRGRRRR